MMKELVIFLDKDGTLVKDVPYNVDPAKIVLEKGAARGLRRLAGAGFRFVLISNQSGVARGIFKIEALKTASVYLNRLLKVTAGVTLEAFYYCPHHPEGIVAKYARSCTCRKPQPGLLLAAAHDLDIDLRRCWMIGDILDDVEAGKRAGCRAILLDHGHETLWEPGPFRHPDFIAASLDKAAQIILSQANDPPALPASSPSTSLVEQT